VIQRDGQPWFVAADVCRCVGIGNNRDAISVLDDDEKGVALTDTLGGPQEVAAVNESGLYALILRSRKAVTPGTVQHRFRKWVTADVLPALRQSGRYGAPTAPGHDRGNSAPISRKLQESSGNIGKLLQSS